MAAGKQMGVHVAVQLAKAAYDTTVKNYITARGGDDNGLQAYSDMIVAEHKLWTADRAATATTRCVYCAQFTNTLHKACKKVHCQSCQSC